MNDLITPLLSWYHAHARILPWRDAPTPYHVWISEIMLQQTRVQAVIPYYERFLAALPDPAALSACEDDRLMKLWEGLGYYNRARNLKKAAVRILQEFDGRIPDTMEALLSLPGIGRYTAGAILSIAYGRPCPAVDGNVLRIWMRLHADPRDIMKESVKRSVEQELQAYYNENNASELTQALMELGATVCTPNGVPDCMHCPWRAQCSAHAEGTELSYPVKTKAKPRRICEKTILLIKDGSRVLLKKRPETGLLAGLYAFPDLDGFRTEAEVLKETAAFGVTPFHIERLPDAKHIFTHVEWHMKGFLIRVGEGTELPEGVLFADKKATEERFPIPAAYAKYADVLAIRLGQDKYR